MSQPLLEAARQLALAADRLRFAAPVAHVYNPLRYAWRGYEGYVSRFGVGRKRVLFLGMNPGPFGMVQTGVPFGDVTMVRDWLGIRCRVDRPACEHPLRPVLGFDCPRSEVSGSRLWGLFRSRFVTANRFFQDHFVANYCPLAFLEASGRNRTPDHLPNGEKAELFAACDTHLNALIAAVQPEWIVGVGQFAADRAISVAGTLGPMLGRITHPSPACPAANRGWAALVTRQLVALGVWPGR